VRAGVDAVDGTLDGTFDGTFDGTTQGSIEGSDTANTTTPWRRHRCATPRTADIMR
jgi:hypothetical protein